MWVEFVVGSHPFSEGFLRQIKRKGFKLAKDMKFKVLCNLFIILTGRKSNGGKPCEGSIKGKWKICKPTVSILRTPSPYTLHPELTTPAEWSK